MPTLLEINRSLICRHGLTLAAATTPRGVRVREATLAEVALTEVRHRLTRLRTTPSVRKEAERWCRDALAQGRTVEESISAAMSAAVALDQGYEVEDTA